MSTWLFALKGGDQHVQQAVGKTTIAEPIHRLGQPVQPGETHRTGAVTVDQFAVERFHQRAEAGVDASEQVRMHLTEATRVAKGGVTWVGVSPIKKATTDYHNSKQPNMELPNKTAIQNNHV